jgi:hypothetical protein
VRYALGTAVLEKNGKKCGRFALGQVAGRIELTLGFHTA